MRTKPFVKHDQDKPKMTFALGMAKTMEAISRVMTFGANKYAKDNWRKAKGEDIERYLDAAIRHQVAYLNGEKIDPDSGLPHIHHAITSLSMYVELVDEKVLNAFSKKPEVHCGGVVKHGDVVKHGSPEHYCYIIERLYEEGTIKIPFGDDYHKFAKSFLQYIFKHHQGAINVKMLQFGDMAVIELV